jgi:hypothetical protein
MFGESFRYATASFRGSTQHFTGPGEACAKTGVCPRIDGTRCPSMEMTRTSPPDENHRAVSVKQQQEKAPSCSRLSLYEVNFTLNNILWLTSGSFLCRRQRIVPKGLSARMRPYFEIARGRAGHASQAREKPGVTF